MHNGSNKLLNLEIMEVYFFFVGFSKRNTRILLFSHTLIGLLAVLLLVKLYSPFNICPVLYNVIAQFLVISFLWLERFNNKTWTIELRKRWIYCLKVIVHN